MIIYPEEEKAGLSEVLSSSASVTYASLVEKCDKDYILQEKKNIKAIASIEDKDLYYTQSILVTTCWNKNDDIFDKSEVWMAKSTPTHKPTNLEHDESIIVGHITSNYPIDIDGNIIDSNISLEDLPIKFHILTGSVIYTGYTSPELQARTEQLIDEINAGTKYVSMECLFRGFDYGLLNKNTGDYKILARSEETAFLTKHLRVYGGVGEHEGYKIGRVLRNITFTGKGFVNKPANPESVIFTRDNTNFYSLLANLEKDKEKKSVFENIGVFSNQANLKENDMNLEEQLSVINEKLEAMVRCDEVVAEAKAASVALTEKTSTLENQMQTQSKELSEVKSALEAVASEKAGLLSEKEELTKQIAELTEKLNTETARLQSELDSNLAIVAGYKEQEEEMKKKEKKNKRMASLLEIGLDPELATSTVEKFENLDDEAFDGIKNVFAATVKKPEATASATTTEEEVVEDTSKSKEDISEVLETAEASETEIDLSVGSEQDGEVDSTRAALVDFVRTVLNKKLKKGE
jgi:hypothetical protein